MTNQGIFMTTVYICVVWQRRDLCKGRMHLSQRKINCLSTVTTEQGHKKMHAKLTCSGVPSNNFPHDKLKRVSPVKIAPDRGK